MHRIIATALAAAALVGCSSVQIDPQRPAATTLAPFNAQLGLNRVSVPVGSQLAPALVDGQPSYCTMQPAWFAILEKRSVCFTDELRSGHFSSYYVTGTLSSLRYPADIPYALMGPFGPAQAANPALLNARDRQAQAIHQAEADKVECQLQGSMAGASSADHSLLGLDARAWSSHVFNKCMELKAMQRSY
jgi:hypothetical protein